MWNPSLMRSLGESVGGQHTWVGQLKGWELAGEMHGTAWLCSHAGHGSWHKAFYEPGQAPRAEENVAALSAFFKEKEYLFWGAH